MYLNFHFNDVLRGVQKNISFFLFLSDFLQLLLSADGFYMAVGFLEHEFPESKISWHPKKVFRAYALK